MTRTMGTRRTALLVGVAAAAAVTLSGCGAGQIAETARKKASVYGVEAETADRSVLIRGLAVVYNSVQGYPAGASAPLEVALFNQTANPVTVRISSTPSPQQTAGVVSARTVNLVGPAPSATATVRPPEAEPSGSAPVREKLPTGAAHVTTGPTSAPSVGAAPSATTATPGPGTTGIPAQIQIEPLDFVRFLPGSSPSLEVVGLSGPLRAGNSVNLVFEFSNGAPALTLQAPMAVPLSPAPRPTIHDNEGVAEGDHE